MRIAIISIFSLLIFSRLHFDTNPGSDFWGLVSIVHIILYLKINLKQFLGGGKPIYIEENSSKKIPD